MSFQKIFHDFENFLRKLPISSKARPFYLHWIKKALRFGKLRSEQPIPQKTLKIFLKNLEKDCEPWQVEQAKEAISLYNYFLSQREKETADSDDQAWDFIREEAKRLMRLRHLSYRTEKAYLSWIKRFQVFLASKTPKELIVKDLQDFLTHLAVEKRVAPSTQNQALNALVFFYKKVLEQKLGEIIDAIRAKER